MCAARGVRRQKRNQIASTIDSRAGQSENDERGKRQQCHGNNSGVHPARTTYASQNQKREENDCANGQERHQPQIAAHQPKQISAETKRGRSCRGRLRAQKHPARGKP